MPVSSMLTRLKNQLYALVQQNNVSDTMLLGPADILALIDGSIDMMLEGGRYLEKGTVTIPGTLSTVIQVPGTERLDANGQPVTAELVDWTKLFKVGDEVIVGGSNLGNTGRRQVTAVNTIVNGQSEVTGYTLSVSPPFVAAETGLVYGKPTFMLRQLCRELLLYPGGWETDTELRALLATWIETMQMRGTRLGLKTEIDRLTNYSSSELLETLAPLDPLGTSVSYTHSTKILTGGTWTSLSAGESVTVVGSTKDSNGRYTVYDRSGSNLVLGHRAAHSGQYAYRTAASMTELQFKEDRVLGLLKVRLINTAATSKTVAFTITVTGATAGAVKLLEGTGSGSVAGGVATLSMTAAGASLASPAASEMSLALTGLSATSTFQVAVTSGTPTAVRLGEMGLSTSGLTLWPWRWGGVVRTGLRSQKNETGLTVYSLARPGFYLEVGGPETIEEDAYTMASPDEFVVVETDHRNPNNYTEQDLKTLVRDVLLPADVDGVLGLL